MSASDGAATFAGDWARFRSLICEGYAYVSRATFDVPDWLDRHEGAALASSSPSQFVDVLQAVVRRFADPHLNVGPYDDADYSVTPTGSDLWVELRDGSPVVVDVKRAGAAHRGGVRPGWVVVELDGQPWRAAGHEPFGTRAPETLDDRTLCWGLNVALGGRRHRNRELGFLAGGRPVTLELAPTYAALPQADDPAVTLHWHGDTPRIEFANALGDRTRTPAAFDALLARCNESPVLLLDLRNTPSGGNTTVARRVMGRFTDVEVPYQRHEVPHEWTRWGVRHRSVALVSPISPRFDGRVAVLVGRWTGSMGEGMAIGMDALGHHTIGSRMAGLLGAIETLVLDESKAWIELPGEALFHVDGTPREDFVPSQFVASADIDEHGGDPALSAALEWASDQLR